jgi:protease-4
MAYDSDYLVDRRRLKRHLTFWRALAVVALAGVVAAAVGRFHGAVGGDVIARIDIDGLIVQDDRRLEVLSALASDTSVRAVILRIDSPGGTVVGGETLYRTLLDLGEKKPVVAVMDGLATSAAYMTAIAADRIYAREGTITGSIGVLMQATEVTRLLDMIGVTAKTFKSGPLKAVPNPMEPITPEVTAATQSLIDEMFAMFRDMVLLRRNLSPADAARFSDGRVFTGRQALKAGLIDEIGGEREAIRWLETERGLPEGLDVRRIKVRRDVDDLFGRVEGLARKTILSERLTLDGLVSVWHPDLH